MIRREEELREYRDRVDIFYAITLIAVCIISARLLYLQILKGDALRKYSESNRLKKERLYPSRGTIYDRNGKIMVDSRASFDVILVPQYYPYDKDTNERLRKALNISEDELQKKLKKSRTQAQFYSMLLKSDVSKETIAAIEMDIKGFPGVDIEANIIRRYPFKEVAAQVLGYVSEVNKNDIRKDSLLQMGDYIGKIGLEREYDSWLRGVNGLGFVEVDAFGRRRRAEAKEKLLGYVTQTPPIAGNDLYLTIDLDLELAAYESMKKHGFLGSVIAVNPQSGEILAMLNLPSFDSNELSKREVNPSSWKVFSNDPERPLRNRAIQDHYPPGSTFKPFLAIAGLSEKLVTKNSKTNCAGKMWFGNRFFNCWKTHGTVDFIRAIRESCDVFFYRLGDSLGIDKIAEYSRMFGLGSPTGIKLGTEQSGLIPDSKWKEKTYNDKWHPGETLSVSIGQGYIAVTPIQLLMAYSAIANNGFLYRPYIVKKVVSKKGHLIREFNPELRRKIKIDNEVFQTVKEGLFQVVNVSGGTGLRTQSFLTIISGKTGTSQIKQFSDIKKMKCENAPYKDRHHGLFVGYAPMDNPEIAVITVAEHACHGSAAGPVVKDVIEAYVKKELEARKIDLTEHEKNIKKAIKELSKSTQKKRMVSMKKSLKEEELNNVPVYVPEVKGLLKEEDSD